MVRLIQCHTHTHARMHLGHLGRGQTSVTFVICFVSLLFVISEWNFFVAKLIVFDGIIRTNC